MDEDEVEAGDISREDVSDAIDDEENTEALSLLTEYYNQISKGAAISKQVTNAKKCAQMLYDAKRYEDVLVWLDLIATNISDKEGPDSEAYMAFTEDEDLEALRMKATDKSLGDEEESDDYDSDDE